MTEPFLKIENIRKEYGSVVAVHNVDLNIDKGEFMTFLGPSGSGKSTTLYILAGFENPTRGDIKINGQSLLSTPSNKRNVGMVFQRYTLFPNLTVGENIAFPLKVRKRPKAEITEKVRQMLKLVRLEGFEDRRPSQMSGGQQQRVALARALAYDPPVLLMDEPLSALDKKLREEIQYEIRRIHHQTEVTILYVIRKKLCAFPTVFPFSRKAVLIRLERGRSFMPIRQRVLLQNSLAIVILLLVKFLSIKKVWRQSAVAIQ